ncbi:LysR family transcriptional regulator [Streptomyces sp. P1-3]|uniref:LysR family transcriptional regulator n=1 Tax=Streptomyces sp. P1-3 TaxID=3421658 RepID=UPI003D36A425
MEIEISDLRLLRAVAETGSLAGAARELGANQGNLSHRLQRIERATGLVLFRRHHHGVTPTAAGRLLLHEADALIPLVDQLLAVTARTPHPDPYTTSPTSYEG